MQRPDDTFETTYPEKRGPKSETAREARARIINDLEIKIRSGALAEGSRLPPETELAEAYGANRNTLREALKDLRRRGLIDAAPRSGTYVANDLLIYTIDRTRKFSEIIREAGRDPGSELLVCERTTAPPEIAEQLEIATRSAVIRTEFLRLANGIPIAWHYSWMPADRFGRLPEIVKTGGALIDAVERLGVKGVVRSSTRISSRRPTNKERRVLQLGARDVALIVDSVNTDANNEPIQAGRAVFSGAKVTLSVDY